MGLGSRTYARSYLRGGGLPSGIKLLLIANFAVFILQFVGLNNFLLGYFGLRPVSIFNSLAVWQFVTYLFLHGDFFHILFNMLALWMFGRDLEEAWGRDRFLRFYFFCGVGAGLCVFLANYLLPWGDPGKLTIGASGAVYGILIASAIMWPTRVVYFNFLFPIQMKYLVIIYGAIAFISARDTGVSHFAHLGGLLFGWIFLKTPALAGGRRRVSSSGMKPWEAIQHRYKQWKLERNKRRFQVYLKKHGSNRPN